jgi:uncharacterized protein
MINRDEVLNILKDYKSNNLNKYDIIELGLFGSVARNQVFDTSDVDICIKTKTPDIFTLVHKQKDLKLSIVLTIFLIYPRAWKN